jgi:hypothetical protein
MRSFRLRDTGITPAPPFDDFLVPYRMWKRGLSYLSLIWVFYALG